MSAPAKDPPPRAQGPTARPRSAVRDPQCGPCWAQRAADRSGGRGRKPATRSPAGVGSYCARQTLRGESGQRWLGLSSAMRGMRGAWSRVGGGAPPAAPPAGPLGLRQDARLGGGGRSRGHALSCTRPEPSSAAATRGPGRGAEGAPAEMKQVRSAPRASGPPAREGTRWAQALSRRLTLAVGAVRGEAQVNSDLSKDKAEDRNARRPEQCVTAAPGTTASPRGRRNRNTHVPPATRPAVHHCEAPRGQTPLGPSHEPARPVPCLRVPCPGVPQGR